MLEPLDKYERMMERPYLQANKEPAHGIPRIAESAIRK